MDTENFQNELNEFIQALTVSDIWQDLKSSQRKIITDRAIADIASYLKISNTEINLEIPEIKQAVFEQTLHLARQLRFQSDGRTILEENIEIPERLAAFMRGEKQTVEMSSKFAAFKKYLMSV